MKETHLIDYSFKKNFKKKRNKSFTITERAKKNYYQNLKIN